MKIKIDISNRLLDGEYDAAPPWTNWELHAMKNLTGLAAGQMGEALENGDPDVVMALAMVGLMRGGIVTGKTPWSSEPMDVLWHAESGKVSIGDLEEEDAGPPEQSANESESESVDASSAKNGSSGDDSKGSSESPALVPSPTGEPT